LSKTFDNLNVDNVHPFTQCNNPVRLFANTLFKMQKVEQHMVAFFDAVRLFIFVPIL